MAGLHYIAGAALDELGEHRRAVAHLASRNRAGPGAPRQPSETGALPGRARRDRGRQTRRCVRCCGASPRTPERRSFWAGTWRPRVETDEAIRLLEQATRTDRPVAADAWHELGRIYRARKDLARAEDAFRRALAVRSRRSSLRSSSWGRFSSSSAGKRRANASWGGMPSSSAARPPRAPSHHALEEGADAQALVNLGRYLLLRHDLDGADRGLWPSDRARSRARRAMVALGQALLEQGSVAGGRGRARARGRSVAERAGRSLFPRARPASAERLRRRTTVVVTIARASTVDRQGVSLPRQRLGSEAERSPTRRSPTVRVSMPVPRSRRRATSWRSCCKLAIVPRRRCPEIERFVELEPRDPRGALLLGVVEHRVGDHAAAAAAFERALDRIDVARCPIPRRAKRCSLIFAICPERPRHSQRWRRCAAPARSPKH